MRNALASLGFLINRGIAKDVQQADRILMVFVLTLICISVTAFMLTDQNTGHQDELTDPDSLILQHDDS